MVFGYFTGFIVCTIILILLNELAQSFYRNYYRYKYYQEAVARSLKINKPLIVIGDPHNGIGSKMHGPAYGTGNYIIDISGCSAGICPTIEQDMTQALKSFDDNSCVIFVSCVLEYLEKNQIKEAIQQLKRVAGSLDNLFVVTVGTSSYSSYFYSYGNRGKKRDRSQRVFLSAPPEGDFNYQEIKR